MVLYVHGDLVDSVQPGDRVSVTGVYRAVPHKPNPKIGNQLSVYKTHTNKNDYTQEVHKAMKDLALSCNNYPKVLGETSNECA